MSPGFTFIEILVVVGVVGIILAALYPSIMNTLETRRLENSARDILTTMQRAKFEAVKTKLNHRVGFLNDQGTWFYFIEQEVNPGTWATIPGFVRRAIPDRFVVTMNLPDVVGVPEKGVVFSPLGFVTNYTLDQNSLSLQSTKLKGYGQPDLRVISVYAGGSIQYTKTGS
ncbi:MAG: prepilin-type N-terminal cleavage/methylation domain-containing protein [Candidatus Aminicenantales bacterium]